jgi:cytochrome c peroxidase
MNGLKIITSIALVSGLVFSSCSKERGCTDINAENFNPDADKDDGSCVYAPTGPTSTSGPTPAPLAVPQLFTQYLLPPHVPNDNPQTVEGIALGRKLFYDPILSSDSTQACNTCHMVFDAFTVNDQFSTGVTGALGDRNSMPIFNVAWNWGEKFFWDGRAPSLEAQALGPVVNPKEMNNTWPNAVAALQAHPDYPGLFQDAFGTSVIDSFLVAKAIAQFERTLISGNSKFDKYLRFETTLTASEINGFNIFMDENAGDCFHCHGSANNPLWTDNSFHNNGLDATFTDLGLGAVTGDPNDNGKFKTPSLRNLVFTNPYMHDGRFATLDDVINHYSEGLVNSPTIDPLMKSVGQGGVQLTPSQKADLKAFLLTLTDGDFVQNPDFNAPPQP